MTSTSKELVRDVVDLHLSDARIQEQVLTHKGIREVRIQEHLNKARDAAMKVSIQGFKKDNNFLGTILSGSKGDFFNVAQISSLLGQQYFKGNRITKILNGGRRSLYHDIFDGDSFEECGFIHSSFLEGLTPQEAYFHAIAGRSGVVDTAMGTGDTGYMQRKLIKLMEDLHIAHDQTVRDERGNIFQFHYSNYGIDVINPVPFVSSIANCN